MKKLIVSALIICAVSAVLDGSASANTSITIEAQDTIYCNPLVYNVDNVNNFRNQMVSIAGYTNGLRYLEGDVWESDLRDPQVLSSGNDTFNFDRSVDAISYFSGHGECDDQTNTACTSTAACPNKSGLTKICTRFTESPLTGRCMYSRPRSADVGKSGGCGTQVNLSTGSVRLGESATSGSWAGAGTNGGINAAVFDVSCGITPDMYQPEYANAFAGVSIINSLMPTRFGSDTWDTDDRGKSWADKYLANKFSSVGVSWADALNNTTGGPSCAFGGGGHGFGGCGAQVSMSVDINKAYADWHLLTETWVELRSDTTDAIGSGWMSAIYTCNYDCVAHPWRL